MSLTDSLKKEYCFCPLEGENKMELLENLVHEFSIAYGLDEDQEKSALNAVLEREKLGSTGLENGVAIPHAKVDFIKEPVVSLAVGRKEIDFDSADGKPTSVYFLVFGSPDHPSEHVQVLSQIAQVVKNSTMMRLIKNSKSQEDLISVFF